MEMKVVLWQETTDFLSLMGHQRAKLDQPGAKQLIHEDSLTKRMLTMNLVITFHYHIRSKLSHRFSGNQEKTFLVTRKSNMDKYGSKSNIFL